MGCCASDSALPADENANTERLLGNDAEDFTGSAFTGAWEQDRYNSHNQDGQHNNMPRRAYAQSALAATGAAAVPFFLPEATAHIPISVQPLQRGTKKGSVAANKPASVQLPLKLVGLESVEVVSAAGHKFEAGGSPSSKLKSRVRAHTALSYFEPECIICLEGFEKSNPRLASKCRCGTFSTANSMHLSCLLAWIEQQGGEQICPVCRNHISFEGSD